MDLMTTAPLLSDDLKEIELRARQMRALAFRAMFTAIGAFILRAVKAPALLLDRPRAA